MNWLYLVTMAYIVIAALRGYRRGFIKVVYSMVAILIMIGFVFLTTPVIVDALRSTSLYDTVEERCEEYAREQTERRLENGTLADSFQKSGIQLPESFARQLERGTREIILESLEAEGVYEKMAAALAEIVLGILAFIVSMIVILFILWRIGRALDLFSRAPVIHLANKIFGVFAGIIQAFVVIWLAFLLIRMTSALPVSASLVEMIDENAILRDLYEHNRLLELLQNSGIIKK